MSRTLVLLGVIASARLATAAPIVVRVADEAGMPVTGATLTVPGSTSPPLHAGSDGTITWDAASPSACVNAQGFAGAVVRPPPAGEIAVTLNHGAIVQGRVVTPAGVGVASVTVTGRGRSCGEAIARTDAQGAYTLAGLPEGAVEVLVTTPLRAPETERHEMRLVRGTMRRLDVSVLPVTEARVLVTGPDGKPVARANVRVLPEWRRFPLPIELAERDAKRIEDFVGEADGEGRVALVRLPQRGGYRVAVTHPDFAPTSSRVAAMTPTSDARAALLVGGRLHVRVATADDTPWPRPTVRLFSDDAADLDLVAPPPAGDTLGVVDIAHLPSGAYSIEVRAPRASPRVIRGVEIVDGKTTDIGTVVLEPGAAIAGKVTSDRAAVKDASVTVATFVQGRRLMLEATTDAAGTFRVDGLDPDGRGDVQVRADGMLPREASAVPAGTEDLVIALDRGGSIRGIVRDADDGALVADFEASLVDRAPRGFRSAGRPQDEIRGHDGTFRFEAVPPGVHHVRVVAARLVPAAIGPIEVVAGGEAAVEVSLERGRTLSGRVVEDGTGRGVPAATVVVVMDQGGTQETETDLDGGFVLDGLAGKARLSVSHPLYVSVQRTDVDVGTLTDALEIALKRGGAVEGTVFGPDGTGMAGAQVSLLNGKRTTSSDDGTYHLDGVAEGRMKATKVDRAGTYAGYEESLVDVKAGQVAHLDFGVASRLHGRLTIRGESAAGARITAWPAPGPNGTDSDKTPGLAADVSDAGRYALVGMTPGPWTLTVAWQGRRFGLGVTYPEGVRDVERDIEVPDLHLAGTVTDVDSGELITDVQVTAWQAGVSGGATMSSSSPDDPESVVFSTNVHATDRVGPDGRFLLLLSSPGTYSLSCWGGNVVMASDDASRTVDVPASRDDVVLKVARGAKMTLRLRDGRTHLPPDDAMVQIQSSMMQGMMSIGSSGEFTFDSISPHVSHVFSAWTSSRAVAFADAREFDSGASETVTLELFPGGDLRLLTPPNALAPSGYAGPSGAIHLVDAQGHDLAKAQSLGGSNTEQVGPGEWKLHHLPEGPLTVTLGEGDAAKSAQVDVREGAPAEADLR